MSIGSKFKSFFALEDEYEYKETVVQEEREMEMPIKPTTSKAKSQFNSNNQNVVSLQSVQKTSKVILFEPRTYGEAQEIADHLQ